jgi:hypothetical protein
MRAPLASSVPRSAWTAESADRAADRARLYTVRRQKHDPCPLAHPVLRLRRTRQAFKLGPLLLRQCNRCRFRDAAHASLNHDSTSRNSGYQVARRFGENHRNPRNSSYEVVHSTNPQYKPKYDFRSRLAALSDVQWRWHSLSMPPSTIDQCADPT